MSGSKQYLLDANVFIEASKRYYSFNVCPGFWKALLAHHRTSRVFSIDRVLDELTGEGDQLSDWSQNHAPDAFFKKTQDQAVIEAFQEMVKWVNAEPQFTPAANADFAHLDNADGWVIAYAKANGLIVVLSHTKSTRLTHRRRYRFPTYALSLMSNTSTRLKCSKTSRLNSY